MEDATPIYKLQENAQPTHDSRKEPLEMMSYNDILKNMADKPHEPNVVPKPIMNNHAQPPRQYANNGPHYPAMEPQQPQQQQQQQFVMAQQTGGGFPGLPYHPQPMSSETIPIFKPSLKKEGDDSFQNEMLALLGVYIVVHTQQFQQSLRAKVPGIFSENGSPSVVGTVMNGVLVIVLWNVCKKFILKYMKDL